MTAKERHTLKLLEYLENPENKWLNRTELAKQVLGIGQDAMYRHFTGEEITEIESQALERRRQRYKPMLSEVDKRMIERAKQGDTRAAKLVYERFEGLIDQKHVISTGKDEPAAINITISRNDT